MRLLDKSFFAITPVSAGKPIRNATSRLSSITSRPTTRGYQRDSPSALLLRRPQEIPLPMEKPKTQISRLTRKVISATWLGQFLIRARVRHDGAVAVLGRCDPVHASGRRTGSTVGASPPAACGSSMMTVLQTDVATTHRYTGPAACLCPTFCLADCGQPLADYFAAFCPTRPTIVNDDDSFHARSSIA